MTIITLNDEQARLIGGANAPIVLVDPDGRQIGTATALQPLSDDASEDEIIAEIKRRMAADDGQRYTHAEVMAQLRALAPS